MPSAWVCLQPACRRAFSDRLPGLDPGRYRSIVTESEDRRFSALESRIPESERYKEATPFVVRCRGCESRVAFVPVTNRAVSRSCDQDQRFRVFTTRSRIPWSRPRGLLVRCAGTSLEQRVCRSSWSARSGNTSTSTTRVGQFVTIQHVEIARG